MPFCGTGESFLSPGSSKFELGAQHVPFNSGNYEFSVNPVLT